MKKLSVLLLAVALVACSNGGNETVVKEGHAEVAIDNHGSAETVYVDVKVDGDGKITEVSIDESYTKDGVQKNKKEWGAEYGMSEKNGGPSKVGEWDEQVKFLEGKLVGTDGTIELDDKGYPTSEDITSGCTINLTSIQKAVLDAVKSAK